MRKEEDKMKLSIQAQTQGKPGADKDETAKHLAKVYKKWENIECTWEQAFDLITVQGYATSAELSSNHRCDENFVSRQLIMIDIDDTMTIEELLADKFYNEYGAGFYVTPSHTDENHRFRIIFRLEDAIKDRELYKKIVGGLMMRYSNADPKCSDAARLYFGTVNCEIFEFYDKVLFDEQVVDLVIEFEKSQQERLEKELKNANNDYKEYEYDTEFTSQLLNRIQSRTGTLEGQYDTWCEIAWATCATVGVQNAMQLMNSYWPTKTQKELDTMKRYKEGLAKHTVGTLISMSNISKEELWKLKLEFFKRNGITAPQTHTGVFGAHNKTIKQQIKSFNRGK